MEFLYFPEDKSEYIPGIISILVIFLLSIIIIRLLLRASRKEVQQLEQQGYPAFYNEAGEADRKKKDDAVKMEERTMEVDDEESGSKQNKKP